MEKWFEMGPPGDIIKVVFHEKTVNLTITLPADMLQRVTNWGIQHGITSRSLAIQWFIFQGNTRITEMEAEMRIAEEERLKKERVERLKEEKERGFDGLPLEEGQSRLTEQDKEELKALDHVYDVNED